MYVVRIAHIQKVSEWLYSHIFHIYKNLQNISDIHSRNTKTRKTEANLGVWRN